MTTIQEPYTSSKLAPLLSSPLPLFKTGANYQDVRQQRLTNCPLPAILAALANASPSRLKSMIKERPGPAKSWFYGKPVTSAGYFNVDKVFSVRFQHASVEVTPILFFDDYNKPRFAYSKDGAGWVSYIEKAYVVYRARYQYENLDLLSAASPVTVNRVMEDLVFEFNKIEMYDGAGTLLRDLEPTSIEPDLDNGDDDFETTSWKDLKGKEYAKYVYAQLKNAKKRATIATTPSGGQIHSDLNLVGMHTYAVTSCSSGKVRLFDAMRGMSLTITTKDFREAFDGIYQAR